MTNDRVVCYLLMRVRGLECEEVALSDPALELERIMRADVGTKLTSHAIVRAKVQLSMNFCVARKCHE